MRTGPADSALARRSVHSSPYGKRTSAARTGQSVTLVAGRRRFPFARLTLDPYRKRPAHGYPEGDGMVELPSTVAEARRLPLLSHSPACSVSKGITELRGA